MNNIKKTINHKGAYIQIILTRGYKTNKEIVKQLNIFFNRVVEIYSDMLQYDIATDFQGIDYNGIVVWGEDYKRLCHHKEKTTKY